MSVVFLEHIFRSVEVYVLSRSALGLLTVLRAWGFRVEGVRGVCGVSVLELPETRNSKSQNSKTPKTLKKYLKPNSKP